MMLYFRCRECKVRAKESTHKNLHLKNDADGAFIGAATVYRVLCPICNHKIEINLSKNTLQKTVKLILQSGFELGFE